MLKHCDMTIQTAPAASFEAVAPAHALNYGVNTGKGRLTD